MSKREDEPMTSSRKGGEDDEPEMTPAPPPEHISSSNVSAGAPAPRGARFGEGPEGRGARRERGVTGARAGFFDRIGQFIHDVRAEMKRVSWPTATEVKNTTIITIIAVIFFAIYLFVVDRGLTFLITQLEKLVGWLLGAV
ncbi:MAG: preprotein translocase subunit SecE [Pyrinomonadaceae bacterium]|nr:preprotein translocase subunit SecE [Pyrinomonadaceae bacterium]